MAVSITIRQVPEGIRDELAARAAREGRSLQEYLIRELSEIAATPPLDDVIRRARERAHQSDSRLSIEDILAARDEDRR